MWEKDEDRRAEDGEQTRKRQIAFPSKKLKSENRAATDTFATFLLLSEASLQGTFYVIYLKIAKYSWIVSRWAIVEVFSFLSDVRWQGLLTFLLPTKISHKAPADFTEK